MENYRELNFLERELLDKLLERPFPGKEEIRDQINNCKVRSINEYGDNWGSIEIKTSSLKKANVESRIPVQGIIDDIDGVPLEIFLHIIDGFIDELEIVKADKSQLKAKLNPVKMKVIIYSEVKKE